MTSPTASTSRVAWFGRDDYQPTWVTLDVTSTGATAVPITLDVTDRDGNKDGSTGFVRSFSPRQGYELTAPLRHSSGGRDWVFERWAYTHTPGGVVRLHTHSDRVLVIDDNSISNDTAEARNLEVRTLSIESFNPTSGITIALDTTDLNGRRDGTTPFTREYGDGTRLQRPGCAATLRERKAPGAGCAGGFAGEQRNCSPSGSGWVASRITTSVASPSLATNSVRQSSFPTRTTRRNDQTSIASCRSTRTISCSPGGTPSIRAVPVASLVAEQPSPWFATTTIPASGSAEPSALRTSTVTVAPRSRRTLWNGAAPAGVGGEPRRAARGPVRPALPASRHRPSLRRTRPCGRTRCARSDSGPGCRVAGPAGACVGTASALPASALGSTSVRGGAAAPGEGDGWAGLLAW